MICLANLFTKSKRDEVVTNCDHLACIRFSYHLPYVFTEHGVAMLSAVLKSQRAVEVSVFIVCVFIRLRELLYSNKELAHKIAEIERDQKTQNKHMNAIYRIIDSLIEKPVKVKDPIGFGK